MNDMIKTLAVAGVDPTSDTSLQVQAISNALNLRFLPDTLDLDSILNVDAAKVFTGVVLGGRPEPGRNGRPPSMRYQICFVPTKRGQIDGDIELIRTLCVDMPHGEAVVNVVRTFKGHRAVLVRVMESYKNAAGQQQTLRVLWWVLDQGLADDLDLPAAAYPDSAA